MPTLLFRMPNQAIRVASGRAWLHALPRRLRLYVTPIIPKPRPTAGRGRNLLPSKRYDTGPRRSWPQVMRHRHPPRGIEARRGLFVQPGPQARPWRARPQLGETPASIVRPVPGQFAVGGQQQGGVAAIAGVRDHRRQQRRAQPAPLLRQGHGHLQQEQRPSMGSASANPPGWPSAWLPIAARRPAPGAGHPRARYRPRRPSAWACRRTRGSRALDGGKAGNIGKKSGSDGHGAQSMPQSTAACRRGRRGQPAAAAHPLQSAASGPGGRIDPHSPMSSNTSSDWGFAQPDCAARPPCCSS